ncbi:MAG: hypothetical protein IKY86_01310 [Clostridia bacterium]|nr:hypothetical protein [Clostridia bacterium]
MNKKGFWGAVLSAVFVVLYYGGALVLFACQPDIPPWAKVLLCLLPIGVCGVTVLVLVQRIRELKSGETDDLDNY